MNVSCYKEDGWMDGKVSKSISIEIAEYFDFQKQSTKKPILYR